jgi:hypothetical protein
MFRQITTKRAELMFFSWFIFWNVIVTGIDVATTVASKDYGRQAANPLLSYTPRGLILRALIARPIVIFVVMIIYGMIKAGITAY